MKMSANSVQALEVLISTMRTALTRGLGGSTPQTGLEPRCSQHSVAGIKNEQQAKDLWAFFEKLKSRDPVAAGNIGDLRAEHEGEARRLRRVAQAVEQVLNDQDLLRQRVDEIIRDFIDHERQHMEMEERIFFPAALNALPPKDWADIALKLADRRDPLYEADLEQKFNMLRRKILEIEAEAHA
jgi:hemerythrin-like domain-containing protein